ncbi:hypothetical protein HDK77DRAFT_306209 [Phyllosticta capitalensis]
MNEDVSGAPLIEPFERAKRIFLDSLPEDQKRLFLEQVSKDERKISERVSIESLFYAADVSQKDHERSSNLHACRKNLRPFFDVLEDYSKALDVASNIAAISTVLAPLWAGLRVVLQIAQKDDKNFKELVEMLRQIGLTLPQFRDYHRLFPHHPRLMLLLSQALANILIFCQKVKSHFSTKEPSSRLSVERFLPKRLGKLRSSLPNYLDDFEKARDLIEKEVNLAHMIEDKQQSQLQVIQSRARRMEDALSKISTFNHRTRYEQLQEERHNGTAEWLTSESTFQSWLTSPARYFTCFGIPGSGKSILASTLVDQMSPQYSNGVDFLGYYFCDYSDPASLQFSAFVVSLVRQALQLSPQPKDLVECIIGEHVTLTRLSEALKDTLETRESLFLVIDGINEFPASQQEKILHFIRGICGPQCGTKIFICCRPGISPSSLDPGPAYSLTIQPQHVQNDILVYVEGLINSKVQNGRLRFDNASLRQEVKDVLSFGAKEMFLWVRFQIEEICECLTSLEIREALRNLPEDLATIYARILSRLPKSHRDTAYAAFRWITCAHRPLKTEELFEALAIEESDDHFHWDRVITDSDKFLRACGNLVVIQVDGTVRLAHETVKQFLLRDLPRGAGRDSEQDCPREVRRLQFSFEDADSWIGQRCIAYLCFREFGSQVTAKRQTRLEIPKAAVMPNALIGGPRGNSPQGKISLVLPEMGKDERLKKLRSEFRIMEYIQEFWAFHLRHVTGDSQDIDSHTFEKRVLDVVQTRENPFKIHPWTKRSYINRFPYKHVYEAKMDDPQATNIPFFIWALEHEVYYLHRIHKTWNPRDFHATMVLLLSNDNSSNNLLKIAACFGPRQIRVMIEYLEIMHHQLNPGIAMPINILWHVLFDASENVRQSLFRSICKTTRPHNNGEENTCFPITFDDWVGYRKKTAEKSGTGPLPWHPRSSWIFQTSSWHYITENFQEVVSELFRRTFDFMDIYLRGAPPNALLSSIFGQIEESQQRQVVEKCINTKTSEKDKVGFTKTLNRRLADCLDPKLVDYLARAMLPWIDEFDEESPLETGALSGPCVEERFFEELLILYRTLHWGEDESELKSHVIGRLELLLKKVRASFPKRFKTDYKFLRQESGESDLID